MVLQRGEPVKIWGEARPGASVKVSFGGQNRTAKADGAGKWSMRLAPMKADANPKTMAVYEDGKPAKSIGNVLVGEVWITNGQSNMEFALRGADTGREAAGRADYPALRVFVQPRAYAAAEIMKDSSPEAKWVVCNPDDAHGFNAVAFFFAERLMGELGVPVGITQSSIGSSMMINWLTREDMRGVEGFEETLRNFDRAAAKYDYGKAMDEYRAKLAEWEAEASAAKAEGRRAPNRPGEPQKLGPWILQTMPQFLYNGKFAPMQGYTARGFLWYQGEYEASDREGVFAAKLARMIESWRKYWDAPEMPFYFVQLPSFDNGKWPVARFDQAFAAASVPNAEMVVSVDLGDGKDVHPKDKEPVGVRAANIALYKIYGKKIPYPLGPVAVRAGLSGNRAHVEFEDGGRGLVARGELRGFEVLRGGEWIAPVSARLDGKGRLEMDGGGKIDGVRYLWKGHTKPDACLFNRDGLPAAPFKFEGLD